MKQPLGRCLVRGWQQAELAHGADGVDQAPVLGDLALLVDPDEVHGIHREGLAGGGHAGDEAALVGSPVGGPDGDLLATGVNADGHREILGLQVTTGEDGAGWLGFFRDLTARGLTGVQLVTSDAHNGLVSAIGATLPGAAWQRCRTH
jgi:Transposase, Mutator family